MTSNGKLTWLDRLLSCVWALAVGAVAFFANTADCIPVGSSDSLLIAFGARPPEHAFMLLWHNAVAALAFNIGIEETMRILYLSGPISLGLLAFLSRGIFMALLPYDLRTWANARRWGRAIIYTLPILGSAVFVFSSGVWAMGAFLSPEMLMLLMFTFSVFFAVQSFSRCSISYFVFIGIVSGILAAETPVAVFVPIFAMLHLRLRNWYSGAPTLTPPPIANPLVQTFLVKWTVASFVLFWIASYTLNMRFFLSATESKAGAFIQIVKSFMRYLAVAYNSMSLWGWFFAVLVVLLPVVFSVVRMWRATNTMRFLLIRHGVSFFFLGVFALLQSSPFSSWWFWRWKAESAGATSEFMLGVFMLGCAYVVFSAICVFIVDVYFRNARLLAREYFWSVESKYELAIKIKRAIMLSGRMFRYFLFPALVLVVIPLAVVGRFNLADKKAAAVVDEYVRAVARESAGSSALITDGLLDASIELAAFLDGRKITALSLMSGHGEREAALRKRADVDGKFADALAAGTAEAMRRWMQEDNSIISNLSVQVGFELWRENRKPMPECGGFVAMAAGFPEGVASSGIKRARELAGKIIEFRESYDISEVESSAIRSVFAGIQWRLSRMCRMRAYLAKRQKNDISAKAENELADRLDAVNPEWLKVREVEERRLKSNVLTLTPKEGLTLSLKRADFNLASAYARAVLMQDENDVSANFAMGMGHFIRHEYDYAEDYLKRALVKAPNEPSILNNLAVVLIRLDRYDEAETNAVKALKLLPKSPEIKETLRRIQELKSQVK